MDILLTRPTITGRRVFDEAATDNHCGPVETLRGAFTPTNPLTDDQKMGSLAECPHDLRHHDNHFSLRPERVLAPCSPRVRA